MSAPPIVVAGAGIGGLAAALSLARAGRRVLVLERAHRIEEVGAGLQIAPNAGRILANLGLEPTLAAVGLEPDAINIRRARDGTVLARLPLETARARWGAPFRVFHRADLQAALLEEALRHEAIEVRAGVRVGGFEDVGGVVRLRAHGDEGPQDIEASALIGADGVRSSVRAHLHRGEGDAPRYSGFTAWRALVPAELAPQALRAFESNLWMSAGAHVVHYPLRDGSIINVVAIVEDEPQAGTTQSSLYLDGPALVRAMGGDALAPDLRALIEAGAAWRHWPLFVRPALARWSRGPVSLLGDAAHPMAPFLAQGAAQAIEDAEALGRAFARIGVTSSDALRAYEQTRMTRAAKMQSASLRQGAYFHLGGAAAAMRDLAIRALGGGGMLMRNAWIYR